MGLNSIHNANHKTLAGRALLSVSLALLLLAGPVAAADNPALALPADLPSIPSVISVITVEQLPTLSLPDVNVAAWPSLAANFADARAEVKAGYLETRTFINDEFSIAAAQINQMRGVVNGMRARVGSPLEITAQSDETRVTSAYAIAVQSSAAMQTSFTYVRALSRVGSTGLSLTFIFFGLAYLMFLRLLDLAISLFVAWAKFVMGVIEWLIKVFTMGLDVLGALKLLLPFFV